MTVSLYTLEKIGGQDKKLKYEKYFPELFVMDGRSTQGLNAVVNMPFLSLATPNDYIFGKTGVTYPVRFTVPVVQNFVANYRYDPISWPTKTGGKMRLTFTGGLHGATNVIDVEPNVNNQITNLKYFDQNGELEQLWANPKTRRVYLSASDVALASPIDLEIRNV